MTVFDDIQEIANSNYEIEYWFKFTFLNNPIVHFSSELACSLNLSEIQKLKLCIIALGLEHTRILTELWKKYQTTI